MKSVKQLETIGPVYNPESIPIAKRPISNRNQTKLINAIEPYNIPTKSSHADFGNHNANIQKLKQFIISKKLNKEQPEVTDLTVETTDKEMRINKGREKHEKKLKQAAMGVNKALHSQYFGNVR